jgi:ppGpp synthetase/RelA/SpoT-type nucleotidyltranferase
VRSRIYVTMVEVESNGGESTDPPPRSDPAANDSVTAAAEASDHAADNRGEAEFNFAAHRREAVDEYQRCRQNYEDCAWAVHSVLKTALEVESIRTHSLEARAKSIESFGRKAAAPSDDDPTQPKYAQPLSQITDLSGVRVITFLLDTVDAVSTIIEREFVVLEKSIKSGLLE